MGNGNRSKTEGLIAEIREKLAGLTDLASDAAVAKVEKRRLYSEIGLFITELNKLKIGLDSVRRPNLIFDPGNPRTVGFFIALALTTQERHAIVDLSAFYGAGLYALYYNGEFEPYSPISKSETPIYVGMALRGVEDAVDVAGQGTPLFTRLGDHRKSIHRAQATLSVENFEYRALVLQSGWESTAENYLIRLFKPVWNKESKILSGFGKHGDSATTRLHPRSPWDSFHAGRNWTAGSPSTEISSSKNIEACLTAHFTKNRVFKSFNEILEQFKESLKQQ